MINVIAQNGVDSWLVDWFKLQFNEETGWIDFIAMARLTVQQTEIVKLGSYKFYKQAIDVFARLDYQTNDLMYYRTQAKLFQMPEAIVDEQVCLAVYGSLY